MDSLFGEGTSLPVRFFIAFIVVFALIGLTAWLIRRFGSGALGRQSTRGRAPRLAVIEAGAVDGRRKLVLIRRDNVEHLVMIGGPTDILVEANIVRGQSNRERASSVADNLTRVLAGADDTSWPPLQPEPAQRPAPVSRPVPLEDSSQWALQPEQAPPSPMPPKRSRSADTLAGLAAELSVRPSEPAPTPRPMPTPAMEAPRVAPKPAPMPQAPAPHPAAQQQQSADQNLADMAQRLEAALRRPASAPAAAAPSPRPAATAPTPPAPKPVAEAPRVAPPVTPPAPPAGPAARAPDVTPPAAATVPEKTGGDAPAPTQPAPAPTKAAPQKSDKPDDMFGSLEEEMANLLGRPAGKPT